jgi:hypothetical protein
MTQAALGSLVVELSANLARFEQDMQRATQVTQQSMGRIEGLAAGAAKALSFIGIGGGIAAAGAALVAFGSNALNALDRLDDLAQKTSLSVEFLDRLQQLATRTGESLDTIAVAAGKFSENVAKARGGDQGLLTLFRNLGISAQDLRAQNIDQLFTRAATAIGSATDSATGNAYAVGLMGKSAREAAPAINDIAQRGLPAARATALMAAEAAKARENLNELKVRVEDVSIALGGAIAARINALAKALEDASLKGDTLATSLGKVFRAVVYGGDLAAAQQKFRDTSDEIVKLDARLKVLNQNAQTRGEAPSIIQRNLETQLESLKRQRDQAVRDINRLDVPAPQKPRIELAPPPAGTGEDAPPRRSAPGREAAREVEDYAARINQALAGAINESAIVKTRELQDVVGALDRLFFEGKLPLDVYTSALERLTGKLAEARAPADELAGLLARTPGALQAEANRLTDTIDEAFFSGRITEQQQRELLALANGYRQVERSIASADQAGQQFTRNLSQALEDLVFDADKSIKAVDVLRAALEDVGRTAFRDQVSKPLQTFAGSAASSLAGGVGDFFKGLFANAQGGLYKVGGSGGVDSQVVAMRATPGETVAVYPQGRARGAANGSVYHIDARGADAAGLARLERTIRELNGSIERRALAAVSGARGRGVEV